MVACVRVRVQVRRLERAAQADHYHAVSTAHAAPPPSTVGPHPSAGALMRRRARHLLATAPQ